MGRLLARVVASCRALRRVDVRCDAWTDAGVRDALRALADAASVESFVVRDGDLERAPSRDGRDLDETRGMTRDTANACAEVVLRSAVTRLRELRVGLAWLPSAVSGLGRVWASVACSRVLVVELGSSDDMLFALRVGRGRNLAYVEVATVLAALVGDKSSRTFPTPMRRFLNRDGDNRVMSRVLRLLLG